MIESRKKKYIATKISLFRKLFAVNVEYENMPPFVDNVIALVIVFSLVN